MHNFLIFIYIIFIFQTCRTIISILSSLRFLKHSYTDKAPDASLRIFIIIPVLYEQQQIIKTLEYFYELIKDTDSLHIIIVTTKKEVERKEELTTHNLLEAYLGINELKRVKICCYPETTGYMAHQLNYAVNRYEEIKSYDLIAIYNADSRPHRDTFKWILDNHKNQAIYQQISVPLKNFHFFDKDIKGSLLKAFSILQVKFSLAHELPRLRRTVAKNKIISNYSNAHCIGHGLFIRKGILLELNKFSEETMTEDLFLGYLARVKGYPIVPIPLVENIDSPTTIKKNFRQKTIWFWGPMYYPYYFLFYIKRYQIKHASLIAKGLIMMVQGIISASAWLMAGILLACLVLACLFSNNINLTILGGLVVLAYGPFQYWLLLLFRRRILADHEKDSPSLIKINEIVLISLLSIVVTFIHSLSAINAIRQFILFALFKVRINKPKTED